MSSIEERKKRWKEHFEEILNRPQPENPIVVVNEGNEIKEINIGLISKDEIIKAMKKLKNGKSGGIDGITTEILKADIVTTVQCLENSLQPYGIKRLYQLNGIKG